jgi:hypothetical protein
VQALVAEAADHRAECNAISDRCKSRTPGLQWKAHVGAGLPLGLTRGPARGRVGRPAPTQATALRSANTGPWAARESRPYAGLRPATAIRKTRAACTRAGNALYESA